MYYLPKDKLGLGLNSIENIATGMRLKNYIGALNAVKRGEEQEVMHTVARVTRATIEREEHSQKSVIPKQASPDTPRRMPRSIYHAALQAGKDLGIEVWKKRRSECLKDTHKRDRGRTEDHEDGSRKFRVYTDGSLMDDKEGKRAGWGWVSHSEDRGLEKESWNRVMGGDDIFTAESAALLDALRNHSLEAHLDIYIDNDSVVSRWEKDTRDWPTQRMETPARGIWNRIQALREARTGETTVTWVHSHVENQKEPTKSKRTCACGGKPLCIPTHEHHRGNDEADAAANRGALGGKIPSSYIEPREGEEDFVLARNDKEVEGSIKKAIKKAQEHAIDQNLTKPVLHKEANSPKGGSCTHQQRIDHEAEDRKMEEAPIHLHYPSNKRTPDHSRQGG
jgi:ribonuclease HI